MIDDRTMTANSRRTRLLWIILVVALIGGGVSVSEVNRSTTVRSGDLDALSSRLRARVVYERPDGIYAQDIAGRARLIGAGGTWPRWSPDGSTVAFVKENSIAIVNVDGTGLAAVARASAPRAVAWHQDGERIFFTDGDSVRAVRISSGEVSQVASGARFLEIDISRDGRYLAATVKGFGGFGFRVRIYDLKTGNSRELAKGCGASYSPDGQQVSNLLSGHRKIALLDLNKGSEEGAVYAPTGYRFDNPFWSNHPDWIVSQSDGKKSDILLHRVSDGASWQITFTGDTNRADLFVYSSSGSG